jgi:hypothetical protein
MLGAKILIECQDPNEASRIASWLERRIDRALASLDGAWVAMAMLGASMIAQRDIGLEQDALAATEAPCPAFPWNSWLRIDADQAALER